MRFIKTLILIVLLLSVVLIGITFSVYNTDEVAIDLVFVQLPKASLSLWLMAAFVLGGCFGMLLSLLTIFTLKTRLGSAKRKALSAQQELDNLRVANLKDAV